MTGVFFIQAGAVLFTEAPSLNLLRSCFSDYTLTTLTPAPDHDAANGPPCKGPGISMWNSHTGETAEIDVQATPWPDGLGESQLPGGTPPLAVPGTFGRDAAAGGFTRAVRQAWHWPEAAGMAAQHRAFVRIRLKGAQFQNGEKIPPGEGILWMLRCAERIAKLPGALAWFCPSAELLLSPAQFSAELAEASATGRPPVHAICSVRIWNIGDWKFLDTAGMGQSSLPDMEFAGPAATTDVKATAIAFMNLCIYLMKQGDVIHSGNTADGPAGKWLAVRCRLGVNPPARHVLRWMYANTPQPPPSLDMQEPEAPSSPEDEDADESFDQEEARHYMKDVVRELAEWQAALPAAREHFARFQQTAEYLALGTFITKSRDLQDLAAAMQGAVLIPAIGVMSNTDKSMPLRPGLALGSFDVRPEVLMRCAFLKYKMYSLYGAPPADDPNDRALQQIIDDDKYLANKRVRIPEPSAGGFEIYAFSVLLTAEDEDQAVEEGTSLCAVYAAPGPAFSPTMVVPLPVLKGKPIPSLHRKLTGQAPPMLEARLRPEPLLRRERRRPARKSNLGKVLLVCAGGVLLVVVAIAVLKGDHPPPKKRSNDESVKQNMEEKVREKLREKTNGQPQAEKRQP